jgi:hypothetical protein
VIGAARLKYQIEASAVTPDPNIGLYSTVAMTQSNRRDIVLHWC